MTLTLEVFNFAAFEIWKVRFPDGTLDVSISPLTRSLSNFVLK